MSRWPLHRVSEGVRPVQHYDSRARDRGSSQCDGIVGVDHAGTENRNGYIGVDRVVVGDSIVGGLVDKDFGDTLRLSVLRIVSIHRVSRDDCVVCQVKLDAGTAVAVDRIVFNQNFASVIWIGVENDAFAVGDDAGAVRGNQLGVIIDEVAAYDVVRTRRGVRVCRGRYGDTAIANADQFALP